MQCSPDMFEVITMSQPPGGRIPEGLKVAFGTDASGYPAKSGPVLAIGGFTFWPMSYYDNRVSFCMVMYDLKWNPIAQVEKPGSRYVYKITLTGTDATFVGQSDQSVTVSFEDICDFL